MLKVERYSPGRQQEWNAFILRSKNGTFLFDRNYMDYHSDRFHDHSLVIRNDRGSIVAVLPANITTDPHDGTVVMHSHQGLTYGGLILDRKATISTTQDILLAINDYLRNEGVQRVVYKAIPWIYHQLPAEEDLYVLFNSLGARLTCREISSTIVTGQRPPFTESRKSGLRKALKAGVTVSESDDIPTFWNILNETLTQRHNTTPVHTAQELALLKSRFPKNIRLWGAFLDGEMLGGTLIYETPQVIHTQYISATPRGKELGAIDKLMQHLLDNVYADEQYLDFGKSTEDHGTYLNHNLIHQKQGFGGRGVCYDTYEWEVR